MDAPDLYPPSSSVSHSASVHIRSIYSYSPHILQHSCPPNFARYTLLGRIDRPFNSYAHYGAFNTINPYV